MQAQQAVQAASITRGRFGARIRAWSGQVARQAPHAVHASVIRTVSPGPRLSRFTAPPGSGGGGVGSPGGLR